MTKVEAENQVKKRLSSIDCKVFDRCNAGCLACKLVVDEEVDQVRGRCTHLSKDLTEPVKYE